MQKRYIVLPVAMLFAWLYSIVARLTHGNHSFIAPSAAITWTPCNENGSVPLKCATLAVPLDYTAVQSKETLQLQLVKVDATKSPKKGSILINPGGPGEGSREWLAGPYAEAQLVATGGAYDLVAFDTRYVFVPALHDFTICINAAAIQW